MTIRESRSDGIGRPQDQITTVSRHREQSEHQAQVRVELVSPTVSSCPHATAINLDSVLFRHGAMMVTDSQLPAASGRNPLVSLLRGEGFLGGGCRLPTFCPYGAVGRARGTLG
jgi:hypothetical protein